MLKGNIMNKNIAYTIEAEEGLEFLEIDNGTFGHKAQDDYMGFNAHQEVLEIDYTMSRDYTSYEAEMLSDYCKAKEGL